MEITSFTPSAEQPASSVSHPSAFDDWVEANDLPVAGEGTSYAANDTGRARRFIDHHIDHLRYVPKFGRWMVWEEHRWRLDEDGAITRLAVEHSQSLLAQASRIPETAQRELAVRQALSMGNLKHIRPMLELACADGRIVAPHLRLDADSWLLGVRNGVVDLRTGTFRAGRRSDLITKCAGTSYEESADCPRWRTFLEEIFAGDQERISYVQRAVGYSLTGEVTEQCFHFLYGAGKNGKSVFTEVLYRLFGEYAQRAASSLLTVAVNGREPMHEIARLRGARLVIGSEMEEGAWLAESRVKDMTGGDTLTGRCLYQEAFDFRPMLKLWMFGNHKPRIRGTDEGIWRRIRLIPFTVQIPEERRDPRLAAKLCEELPGILRWALEGVRAWQETGLQTPVIVSEAGAEYRSEEDSLGGFIADEIVHDRSERTNVADVFARYKNWAERVGLAPMSQIKLGRRLVERGFQRAASDGERFWTGVTLK
ncbi:MAG TPA: phage/plasmid primase, P4 family [Chthoniobacter sp.]|jgi:putative DNA primase/helicase